MCDYNKKLYILYQVIILTSKLAIDREGDREKDIEIEKEIQRRIVR